MSTKKSSGKRSDVDEMVLPSALEAERAVLGAILLHNDAYDRASRHLTANSFFRDAHRRIWASFQRLLDVPGGVVDLPLLKADLTKHGDLDEVGGPSYITALVDGVPRSSNVEHYALVVKDKSLLRECIAVGNHLVTDAYIAEEEASAIIARADQAIVALQHGARHDQMKPFDHSAYLDGMEYRNTHKGELTGVTTGFQSINDLTLGWQRGDMVVVAARPSIGKAQPLTSNILLSTGHWARMGDLRVGDELAAQTSHPSFVTGIFSQGVQARYKVTFIDGRTVEVSGGHLWETYTSRRVRRRSVMTTRQMARLLALSRYRSRLSVPLCSGEFGTARDWPVDPWLLGFLIGDGTLHGSGVHFTTADAQIVDEVSRRLPLGLSIKRVAKYEYTIRSGTRGNAKPGSNTLLNQLRQIGAWNQRAHEKRIPGLYLQGDYDSRLELLQGLLDSDGWAQGSVCYCTVSEGLALDVQAIARSLGSVAKIRSKSRTYRYKGNKLNGRTAYEIVISHRAPTTLFTLQRKASRAKFNARRQHLTIVSIELCGETAMQCISVSHPSGLYITDGYTVTHNTTFVLNAAEHAAEAGAHVAVFSLEMKRRQIDDRRVAARTNIDLARIRSGYVRDEEYGRVSEAIGRMAELSFFVDDTASQSVNDIRATCRRLRSEHGLDLVVIDYIQLMPGTLDRRGATRNEEVTHISRTLKVLAGDLNVPMLVLSQLSRASEGRADPRPKLSDLRESGALEQDADTVMFLHRKHHRESGTTEAIFEKERNGSGGTVHLTLTRETCLFVDGGEPLPPATEEEKQAAKTRAIIKSRSRSH